MPGVFQARLLLAWKATQLSFYFHSPGPENYLKTNREIFTLGKIYTIAILPWLAFFAKMAMEKKSLQEINY